MYREARPIGYDINADGSLTLQILYRGDEGDEKRLLPLTIRQTTAPDQALLKNEAIKQLAILNASANYGTFLKTVLDQPINLSPIEDPGPTEEEIAVRDFTALVRELVVARSLNRSAFDIQAAVTAVESVLGKASDTLRPKFLDVVMLLSR